MEYYAAVKKKNLLDFATAWTDLGKMVLNELGQSVKENYHMISLICGV